MGRCPTHAARRSLTRSSPSCTRPSTPQARSATWSKEENGLDSFALAQRARCRGQEQRGLCGMGRSALRVEREKVPLRFVLPGARQQEIASEDIAHNEGVQMRE